MDLAINLSDIYSPGEALGGRAATLGTLITPLIANAVYLTAILSFLVALFAGFNYITSGGDKNKVEQSTNMLNYALVGLVLAVSAFVILRIVGAIGGFDFLKPFNR